MSDIATARELIQAARQRIEPTDPKAADLLARAEQMMWRAKPGKPIAPVEVIAVTDEIRAAVLAYVSVHPDTSLRRIADKFQIGIGRASEVINDKR